MKLYTTFLAALLALVPAMGQGEGMQYTLFTASTKGTYYQFGQDIQRACPELKVDIVSTHGSLDNINNLVQIPKTNKGYRFAFAQNDVVVSVLGPDKQSSVSVKTISPLYFEDISVLVSTSSNIASIKDLDGKKVSIGVVGSGNWFTANALRSQLGLSWKPVERLPEESILSVITGEIDAMILVTGHPFKLFTDLDEKMKGYVKLISLRDVELNKSYITTKLPAKTYQWQDNVVELRSTPSLLIAATDVPPTAIKELVSCIIDKQAELQKWGHPRWKDVQFSNLKNIK